LTKAVPENVLSYSCGDTWMYFGEKISYIRRGNSTDLGPFILVGRDSQYGTMAFPDREGIYLRDGKTGIGIAFGNDCGALDERGQEFMLIAPVDDQMLLCYYTGCG
jgi:hypothetical protein